MVQLKAIPTRNTTTNRTKIPDFGEIYIDGSQIRRIGWAQFIELLKIPEDNTVPTEMAVFGFRLSPTDAQEIVTKLIDSMEPEEAVKQVIDLSKLFSVEFTTTTRTLNNYPFCKIDLLTEDMLEFMNEQLGTNIDYHVYETAMKTIFTKEKMRPLFRAKGVSDAPNYTWDTASLQEDDDLVKSLTALLQKVNKTKTTKEPETKEAVKE